MIKHDIAFLGYLNNGLGFYRFSYYGSDKAFVGVIAQEVQTVMPEAVIRGRDGFLIVLYDQLGLRMQTYDHWIASGAHVPVVSPNRGGRKTSVTSRAEGQRSTLPWAMTVPPSRAVLPSEGRQSPPS
jgi:hypothetical protein